MAGVTEILIRDFNTGKKIFDGEITSVKPRAQKSDDEKSARSEAEIFTPPETVKFMVDAAEALIDSRWLEVACGEAPFVTTRYDAESGEDIPAAERVGILDRKLRACPANVDKFTWATEAVMSVYGYEISGDSLLIARDNVLSTAVEFVGEMSAAELENLAEIVARNFWLMDGLNVPEAQGSLFAANECKVVDWRDDEKIFPFTRGAIMKKFDVLISNPPYQDDTVGGNKNFASPVYHYFMQEAPKIAEKSVLITPARFLFDAGATPKKFNRDMLNDEHFKVLSYEPDAKKVFRRVDIEGGVAVTLYDTSQTFEPIGTFIPWDELRSVCDKVVNRQDFEPFNKIISGRTPYLFTDKFHDDFPDAAGKLSNGHAYDISSNVFETLPEIFFDDANADSCRVLGRSDSKRVYRWIKREYVCGRGDGFVDKWKVFVPKANGASGKLSVDEAVRIISTPVIGEPSDIATDTFLVVGTFDSRDEAEACLKFVKSKFARVLLGSLKVTPVNPKGTWAKVPLQDFSASSDIDWHGDVDEQLYRKYNLSDAEIAFIESHVKSM